MSVESIVETTLKKNKLIIFLVILITIPLTYYFSQKKYYNHVEIYFSEADEDLQTYKKFQEIYGNEEQFLIVFEDVNIFTNENIDVIRKISEKVKNIEGVLRVFSLSEAEVAISEEDSVMFQSLFPRTTSENEKSLSLSDLKWASNKAQTTTGIKNTLISEDSKVTAIILEVQSPNVETKRILMQNIIQTAEKQMGNRLKLRYAGIVYIETEMNHLTQRDSRVITPIILFLILLISAFFLKNAVLAFITLLNLVLITLWSIGFFVFMGETFEMISSMMTPILLAISVASSIHLLAQFNNEMTLTNNFRTSVKKASMHIWAPCLFTSLTTGAGFMSFLVSTMRPVRVFGLYTALGILISFIFTVTFLPAVLLILERWLSFSEAKRKKQQNDLFSIILLKIGLFTTEKSRIISGFTILLFILTAVGIKNIKVETNQAEYFPKSNKMRQDMDYVNNNMVGSMPINLLITATSEEYDFTQPKSIQLLDHIKSEITDKYDNITVSFAISDYFKEVNKAFNNDDDSFNKIPDSRLDILDYIEIGDTDLFERMVKPDFSEARIAFQSKMIPVEVAVEEFEEIEAFVADTLGPNYTHTITGLSKLYIKMDSNLKVTFLKSFTIAFVLIFLMMYAVSRNFYLACVTMIPNIFPVAITLGIMGWFEIPLDVATIMIASVVMGIAVDDTIHFTVSLKRNAKKGMPAATSIVHTFSDVGRQLVTTSLVLFLGFSVLFFGSIIPVKTFGIFTGFSMLFALAGDLIVLPALIIILKPRL